MTCSCESQKVAMSCDYDVESHSPCIVIKVATFKPGGLSSVPFKSN